MTTHRSTLLRIAVSLGALMALPSMALSQDAEPTAPLSLVNVFSNGGSAPDIGYPGMVEAIRLDRVNVVAIDRAREWIVARDEEGKLASAQIPDPQVGSEFAVANGAARTGDDKLPTVYGLDEFLTQNGVVTVTPPSAGDNESGQSSGPTGWTRYLITPLIFAAIGAFFLISIVLIRRFRGGGGGGGRMAGHGKISKTALAAPPEVRFSDVAGCDECVEELSETVSFLSNPVKFTRVGAKMPRGVILQGPPGTGKTLLAKAVAGEAGVPFYAMSGSDFVDTYVGVGSSRVRDLFAKAREHAEGAVIFMDEIDAIGRARAGGGSGNQGDSEREGTLNALLVELDGFGTRDRIIVIAATNRIDILDKALTRPGRFDRHVNVPLPAEKGRLEILGVHAKGMPMEDTADLEKIASYTGGFSGADLAQLVNEAAIMAARDDRDRITLADLEEGMLRSIAGPRRKDRALAEGEIERIAWHEAGHALAAELCVTHPKTQRVSISARGATAGLAMFGSEDSSLFSPQQLHEKMVVAMAGRAAEQLRFSNISSGAANDLEQVNTMARTAIERFGFSELVGQLITGMANGPYSTADTTRQQIDVEVARMAEHAYLDAYALLQAHSGALDALAVALLAGEQLGRAELDELMADLPATALERSPRWRQSAEQPAPVEVVPIAADVPAPRAVSEAESSLSAPAPSRAREGRTASRADLRDAARVLMGSLWSMRPRAGKRARRARLRRRPNRIGA
ncbi:AAA family ATPase [Miltoncostaea oceani]|uniref:AAA family ATPase n=1 Tax=Miltoncostaea oceani TaxID=2843216 RepID=UPI001C3E3353|nr:AAA family ATPase [Miltoncostaea oceani]